MAHDVDCWKCGASLAALSLPFGRIERCKACGTDLHCCRQCTHYDRSAWQQCREQSVEEVREKDRANFCDHFKPVGGRFVGADAGVDAARAALESLFGKK